MLSCKNMSTTGNRTLVRTLADSDGIDEFRGRMLAVQALSLQSQFFIIHLIRHPEIRHCPVVRQSTLTSFKKRTYLWADVAFFLPLDTHWAKQTRAQSILAEEKIWNIL